MKPGQITKKFRSKKGKEIILRFIDKEDTKDCLRFINGIIEENDFIMLDKKITLKEEQEWVSSNLKALTKNKKIQLMAVYNNKIIGNCGIEKGSGRISHVGAFGISLEKEFREDGIGEILAKEAIRLSKKHLKIKLIKLSAFEDNNRAINLYKKLGFNKYGVLPRAFKKRGRYVDQIYMYKEL